MIKRIYKNIPVSIKIIWLILVANLVNVVLDPVVPSILVLCFVFIIFTFAAVNMGYQAQKSEYKDIGTSKEAFKTNCEYFQKELPNLLKNPLLKDKFVVIWEEKVKNAFDDFHNALVFAVNMLPIGEFVIQQVVDYQDYIFPVSNVPLSPHQERDLKAGIESAKTKKLVDRESFEKYKDD